MKSLTWSTQNQVNEPYVLIFLRFNHVFNSERSSSLFSFLKTEVTRDYRLENDEEMFSIGREKFYLFMKIPKELEKFMFYGVMHCTDSFLFVYTYLPVRVFLALSTLVSRLFSSCFG